MGEDHATTEADRRRDDQCIDGQFTASTRRSEQVTSDSSSARSRGHDLREAARQYRIDRSVSAATAVQLHEHHRWNSYREVPLVGASERRAHKLMALQGLVWARECGQRLAVKN